MRKFQTEPLPYYCSIGETGTDAGGGETGGGGGAPPPGGDAGGEGGEGDKGAQQQSLRQQLEKGFEDGRRSDQGDRNDKGQFKRVRRNAGGAELDDKDQGRETGGQVDQGQQQTQAPEAFSKEAKAEWANVPPNVQAAILKREQDTAKGVEELKGKYTELDKALQPHMEAIRKHGHTPAQAVGQLFAWFQALANNPKEAFPALAKSFNFDPATVFGAQQPVQGQQGQQPQGQQQVSQQTQQAAGQAEIPDSLKQYISSLEENLKKMLNPITQEIGNMKTAYQRESEEKTNTILMNWAKDKPHFEEVRQHMGYLVGSGAVPLKDGKIDLDSAYDMAIHAVPTVRAKVLAAQAEKDRKEAAAKVEAERKAQAEQAAKARGAGISVNSGAPGAPGQPGQQRQRARKSVRETLKDAFEEARDQ